MLGDIQHTMTQSVQNDAVKKNAASDRPVLKMKSHSRMGGSVPVWEAPTTAKEKVSQRLDLAGKKSFESQINTAAFTDTPDTIHRSAEKPFGFGDLVDMVNPLHHIPVVGEIYRNATGDEIRGISKIVGGGVFGGPAGAAGGLANVAVKHETGKDVSGHIKSVFKSDTIKGEASKHYELAARLNEIEPGTAPGQYSDPKDEIKAIGREYIAEKTGFLGTSLAVADLTNLEDRLYEKVDAGTRMGGTVYQPVDDIREFMPPREPITDLRLFKVE